MSGSNRMMVEVPGSFVPKGQERRAPQALQQGMPVPPVPPRSGPAPTDDPLSPTTLILNYLRAHNVQPTAANVREAVLANAREGNALGPDPVGGLRSDRPATEEEDQAAMRAARGGAGRRGGGGGQARGVSRGPMDKHDDATSAPPQQQQPIGSAEIAQQVLNQSGRTGVPSVPLPPQAPPAGSVPEVPPPEASPRSSAPPAVTAPEAPPNAARTMGAPTSGWPTGTEAWAEPAPNPWEVSMQRATGAPSVPEVAPAPRFSGITVPNYTEGISPPPTDVVANANTQRGPTTPAEVPGDTQFRRTGSGLQVTPNAATRALPGAVTGAARGAAGGPAGAIAGGLAGAAPSLIPYIMKNLHLF